MKTDQLLTPKQVAAMLQIHVGTLEAWRGRNEGPKFMKLGTGSRAPVRYKQTDIEAFTSMKISAK